MPWAITLTSPSEIYSNVIETYRTRWGSKLTVFTKQQMPTHTHTYIYMECLNLVKLKAKHLEPRYSIHWTKEGQRYCAYVRQSRRDAITSLASSSGNRPQIRPTLQITFTSKVLDTMTTYPLAADHRTTVSLSFRPCSSRPNKHLVHHSTKATLTS